jgi:general secretion pathway protein A
MSYYKLLGLEKEPFSTSPDPYFFYGSTSHQSALRRLEINIRLKRGLSLIFGEVGTGKTVLCRVLAQLFRDQGHFIFHLLLDPGMDFQQQFLSRLVKLSRLKKLFHSRLDYKEAIERFLFRMGVEKNKTIIFIIDEGQKLGFEDLEFLRMLLNYETNEYKLLQLVIMSQLEIIPKLKRMRNFLDRASLKYTINPLDENETSELIEFRLRQAGYSGRRRVFDNAAVAMVFRHTQGYPRRIAMLCHEALKAAVMEEKILIEAADIERIAPSLKLLSL